MDNFHNSEKVDFGNFCNNYKGIHVEEKNFKGVYSAVLPTATCQYLFTRKVILFLIHDIETNLNYVLRLFFWQGDYIQTRPTSFLIIVIADNIIDLVVLKIGLYQHYEIKKKSNWVFLKHWNCLIVTYNNITHQQAEEKSTLLGKYELKILIENRLYADVFNLKYARKPLITLFWSKTDVFADFVLGCN